MAFLFVTGAGLATTIGSAFVFCTGLANQKMLAGALGASAGVMLYVRAIALPRSASHISISPLARLHRHL